MKALKAMGAAVDYASQRVTFPQKMVEDFVNILKKKDQNGHREFAVPSLAHLETQIAQFFYDYARQKASVRLDTPGEFSALCDCIAIECARPSEREYVFPTTTGKSYEFVRQSL